MASTVSTNGAPPPGPPPTATATGPAPTAGTDVWQRSQPILNLVLAAVLVVSTIFAAIDADLTPAQRLLMLGTVLALGVWHWRLVAVRPDARDHPWLMVL